MIALFFTVLGCIGLFLIGMKLMSESLLKLSGERLRGMIRTATINRLAGATTGFTVTACIQASSATVMLVTGLVNARLLTLRESLSLIMGANVGTTMKFWLIAWVGFEFDLTQAALPVAGAGTILYFLRAPRLRATGRGLLGFALLFASIGFLKNSLASGGQGAEMMAFVAHFANGGPMAIIGFFIGGILLAFIFQSSSVAGTITMAMAAGGMIDFHTACALILGENIGTTITPLIASLACGQAGRRAALFHLLFNVIGCIWAFLLFIPFSDSVLWITKHALGTTDLKTGLALYHTLFNSINLLLLIGFIPKLATLCEKLLPERKIGGREKPHLRYLNDPIADTGELHLYEGTAKVRRLAKLTTEMLDQLIKLRNLPPQEVEIAVEQLKGDEYASDELSVEIIGYSLQCAAQDIAEESARRTSALIRVVSELENANDAIFRIARLQRRMLRKALITEHDWRTGNDTLLGTLRQIFHFIEVRVETDVTAPCMESFLQLTNYLANERQNRRATLVNHIIARQTPDATLVELEILGLIDQLSRIATNIVQTLRRG
ncbi:MAG: Na/Pi symporter [Verrucomicrobiota bacterium]|nr:Na/Pi symporter [Verrucomicrobiota bacterium]